MRRLDVGAFRDSLDRVVSADDRIIVVYSGIWTFGAMFATEPSHLPRMLLDAILDRWSDRTVVFPTYTYAYAQTRRYDPVRTAPETGVLATEFLFGYPSERSPSALNSYAVMGPEATRLGEMIGSTLWGEGSVMAYLEAVNARICCLGLPWERACAFFHRMEEANAVPYRYYKAFPGIWVDGEVERPWNETMYVRRLDVPMSFRWSVVSEALRVQGHIRSGSSEFILESALAREITRVGSGLLREDPYALLANGAEVRDWVDRHSSVAE